MFTRLTFVSSNENKLKEFGDLGLINLDIETGVDLQEVDGTPDQVIIHKAMAAGADRMVEDSILVVNGETLMDARWRLSEVGNWAGLRGVWEVRLGINTGTRYTSSRER